ncbi:MAG TPA: hypothetical protein VNS63_27390 [Blastocatellia bacterium]|nr:hypothetical protein [Blastocatellia bacterium]
MSSETETNPYGLDTSTKLAHPRSLRPNDDGMGPDGDVTLITFGFTIYKFFQIELRREEPGRLIGSHEFGLMMVSIGLISLVLATWQNRRDMQRLRALHADVPWSNASLVASLVSLLGIVAFVVMIFRL